VRLGLDTNALVYAHLPAATDHTRVHAYLTRHLTNTSVKVALTPLVLHEFVHVVTDARRFTPPLSMDQALAVARTYLGKDNVEVLAVDEDAVRMAFLLLERHSLGRKRIADALIAATLLTHGVSEIVTCNPDDFVVFDELRVTDPRLA
jgi:predicted nucleic acid-binding protein